MKLFQSRKFAWLIVALITAQLLAACGSVPAPVKEINEPDPVDTPVPETPQHVDESSPEAQEMEDDETAAQADKIDPLVFQQAVRKLWEDHVTWTRVYIIAALADLPEAEAATQRLLQNQTDLGDAIKPFYGEEAGAKLTSLLREHILIAADLLAAAKAGDDTGFEDAHARWYENAEDIAVFLNTANPDYWALDEMHTMMKEHLDLTLEEASARLNQDWAADVAAYDKVHREILHMADMVSEGIIRQFPNQFAAQTASSSEIGLTLAMDTLWEDHVTWTRMYIMSATSDLPDVDAAAGRLLQNQVDIGDALKPLYGEEAGAQLTSLLNDHILIAVDLLAAAKAGDTDQFDDANERWYENADDIAVFLSTANPDHWELEEMQSMMRMHLDLTLEEASARLNEDWSGDVIAYDKVHEEILEMAQMLARGIVTQFEEDFE